MTLTHYQPRKPTIWRRALDRLLAPNVPTITTLPASRPTQPERIIVHVKPTDLQFLKEAALIKSDGWLMLDRADLALGVLKEYRSYYAAATPLERLSVAS
jgi:hypothetical protein